MRYSGAFIACDCETSWGLAWSQSMNIECDHNILRENGAQYTAAAEEAQDEKPYFSGSKCIFHRRSRMTIGDLRRGHARAV